ncbi:hypothetical protein B296_00033578 [Ensete ventricosum]|uniref:Uncharacterized protein n=1 Tax=Ensete ventricosum TaxID=4639 RepID=A0A426YIP9_ENSVE|nr:hypothetical protein B296_00033578 [Ensete ventricosum]
MWCSRRPNRLTAERENLPVKPRCSCASVEKLPCFTGREEMSRICASSFEMAALTVVFFCIVREPIVYVNTCCASFAVHFVATGILSNLRCSLNHAPTASAPRQQWPCLKEHCVVEVGI